MTTIWELDFYSRPVLDEANKKKWEVLICESPQDVRTPIDALFRYAEFCASTEVNSVRLRESLEKAIAQAPNPPDKIRFFRRQMNNMITKACGEAGVVAYPSRRTLALAQWLRDRMETVYPALPTYQPSQNPSVMVPPSPPKPLPDALLGEKWMFVNLEAQAFAEMPEWEIGFSEAFPLELAGVQPDTQIPGVIIFSNRAMPLAAWISGLELAFLTVNPLPGGKTMQLVLETGANDAWILANLSTSALQAEANNFVAAKQAANGVQFLAVQENPQTEAFAGFWLMQEQFYE